MQLAGMFGRFRPAVGPPYLVDGQTGDLFDATSLFPNERGNCPPPLHTRVVYACDCSQR